MTYKEEIKNSICYGLPILVIVLLSWGSGWAIFLITIVGSPVWVLWYYSLSQLNKKYPGKTKVKNVIGFGLPLLLALLSIYLMVQGVHYEYQYEHNIGNYSPDPMYTYGGISFGLALVSCILLNIFKVEMSDKEYTMKQFWSVTGCYILLLVLLNLLAQLRF
jgi:hypothetical protein